MNSICTIIEQWDSISISKWLVQVPWAKTYKYFVSANEWEEIMKAEYSWRLQEILKNHHREAVLYEQENIYKKLNRDRIKNKVRNLIK